MFGLSGEGSADVPQESRVHAVSRNMSPAEGILFLILLEYGVSGMHQVLQFTPSENLSQIMRSLNMLQVLFKTGHQFVIAGFDHSAFKHILGVEEGDPAIIPLWLLFLPQDVLGFDLLFLLPS